MNRLYKILIFIFVTIISTSVEAQIVKGEIFAGAHITQVDGDECYGFRKFGVHAGAGALVPVTKWMDIGLEVIYSQKGARKRDTLSSSSTFARTYKLNLDYVEVPLMIYFTDKNRYSLGVGVSYGRLVRLVEEENGIGTGIKMGNGNLSFKEGYETDFDITRVKDVDGYRDGTGVLDIDKLGFDINQVENSDSYKPHTCNIIGAVKIRIWQGLHIEARYEYSLAKLRTRVFYRDQNQLTEPIIIHRQYNNCITLRLVYVFEKRAKDIKEELKQQ